QIENDPKEAAKPEQVKAGMIKGRINKELKEICLVDQVYVKAEDGKQTVAQYIAQTGKENNANVKVTEFVRFETGEGLEKRNEDFAAEVAKQMGK
ncbi:MAG: elongation factor Ts, partial [Lachnospiraceae bacterium]|nr:elongation factor Ts [Lachnospiraceae bacterium]